MKRKTILYVIALATTVLLLAAALCSCGSFSNYDPTEYDKGVENDPVMPRTSQLTGCEEIVTKHYHDDMLVFLADTYILTVKYERGKYESEKETLLSSAKFMTEPIDEPEYGSISSSFELDGFHFSLLALSEYPKNMYFIGYNDELRQIAYVWFYDVDLDYIESQFDQFLIEFGWELPKQEVESYEL